MEHAARLHREARLRSSEMQVTSERGMATDHQGVCIHLQRKRNGHSSGDDSTSEENSFDKRCF